MGMPKICQSVLEFLREPMARYGIPDRNEIIKSLCDNAGCVAINGNDIRQLFAERAEVKDLPHHFSVAVP